MFSKYEIFLNEKGFALKQLAKKLKIYITEALLIPLYKTKWILRRRKREVKHSKLSSFLEKRWIVNENYEIEIAHHILHYISEGDEY